MWEYKEKVLKKLYLSLGHIYKPGRGGPCLLYQQIMQGVGAILVASFPPIMSVIILPYHICSSSLSPTIGKGWEGAHYLGHISEWTFDSIVVCCLSRSFNAMCLLSSNTSNGLNRWCDQSPYLTGLLEPIPVVHYFHYASCDNRSIHMV